MIDFYPPILPNYEADDIGGHIQVADIEPPVRGLFVWPLICSLDNHLNDS